MEQEVSMNLNNVQSLLTIFEGDDNSLKKLLLQNAGVIYQCKVCQNMFRSLANLTSHKRHYCKEHKCESMLAFNHEIPGDLETENPPPPEEEDEEPTANENICPVKAKPKLKKKSSSKKKNLGKKCNNSSSTLAATNLVDEPFEKAKPHPFNELSDSSSLEEMSVLSEDSNTTGNEDPHFNQEQFEFEPTYDTPESFKAEQEDQDQMIKDYVSRSPLIIDLDKQKQSVLSTESEEKEKEHFEQPTEIELLPFVKEEIIQDNEEMSDVSEELSNEPNINNSTDVLKKLRVTVIEPNCMLQLIKANYLNMSKNKPALFKGMLPPLNKNLSTILNQESQGKKKPLIVLMSKKPTNNNLLVGFNDDDVYNGFESLTSESSDSDEDEEFIKESAMSFRQPLRRKPKQNEAIIKFPCPFCKVVLTQSSSFTKHLETIHNKSHREIEELQRSKSDPVKANSNSSVNTKQVCKKENLADDNHNQKVPLKINSGKSCQQDRIIKKFPCPFCSIVLRQISTFTRHLEINHGKSESEVEKLKTAFKKKPLQTDSNSNSYSNSNSSLDLHQIKLERLSDNKKEMADKQVSSKNNVPKLNVSTDSMFNVNSRPKRRISKKKDDDFVK